MKTLSERPRFSWGVLLISASSQRDRFLYNPIPYVEEKDLNWGISVLNWKDTLSYVMGSCHKRQKPQTPTPQAPIRNRQTRNAKGLNRNTNLT